MEGGREGAGRERKGDLSVSSMSNGEGSLRLICCIASYQHSACHTSGLDKSWLSRNTGFRTETLFCKDENAQIHQ